MSDTIETSAGQVSEERLRKIEACVLKSKELGNEWEGLRCDELLAMARELLSARTSTAPVAVKPLEWHDIVAPTPFGTYTVMDGADDRWRFTYHEYPYGTEDEQSFDTEAEAKAAAFADYETRIRAALA